MVQNETGMFVMPYKKIDSSKSDMDEDLVNKVREISKLRKSISVDLPSLQKQKYLQINLKTLNRLNSIAYLQTQ